MADVGVGLTEGGGQRRGQGRGIDGAQARCVEPRELDAGGKRFRTQPGLYQLQARLPGCVIGGDDRLEAHAAADEIAVDDGNDNIVERNEERRYRRDWLGASRRNGACTCQQHE